MTTTAPTASPALARGTDAAAIERVRRTVHGENEDPLDPNDLQVVLSSLDIARLRAVSAETRAWGYGRILEEIDEHFHDPDHIRAFLTLNNWKRVYGAGPRAEIWAKGAVTVTVPRSFAFHESCDLTARLVIAVAHADRTTPQHVLAAIAARPRG